MRSDLTGRAVRLIDDGLVDREGVAGLAKALFVSERHLNRTIQAELGTGPLAIARAKRAQTARILIETTTMNFGDIAFASGFSSIRQFNDTVVEVFASTPSDLRTKRRQSPSSDHAPAVSGASVGQSTLSVRLPYRPPFDCASIFRFLEDRAIAGVETVNGNSYQRALRLPSGSGSVRVNWNGHELSAVFKLSALTDLGAAISRVRRLFDLDLDPTIVSESLSADPHLKPVVERFPGLRSPGSVDPHEVLFRAILGQQVSVAAARTHGSRLAALLDEQLSNVDEDSEVVRLFPSPVQIAELAPRDFALPTRRAETLLTAARALRDGDVRLDPGVDHADARRQLEALPGIGPWTAGYVLLRGLSNPDICLESDLVARNAARALGIATSANSLALHAPRWAPWRSYATAYLWAASSSVEQAHAAER